LLALPRFKVEYGAKLNDALTALGMGVAFDDQNADFTLMAETDLNIFINQVKHKTYIDVDEYGTEAAAVTMVEMGLTSAPMEDEPEPFEMIVDRPFIIAIRDNHTGALLFLGSIVEP
jgi:serpin B